MATPVTSAAMVANEALQKARLALEACDNVPVINQVYVAAGLIAWDDCCGMLIAAPERIFRTASFPREGPDANGCFDGLVAVSVVVLLVRCIPVLDDRGNAPTSTALNTAYSDLLNEGAIVWNALSGTWPEDWEATALTQTFMGAEGGCIGVESRLTLGIPQELWCPTCTVVV